MLPDRALLYLRELPGGGFVSIEGEPADDGSIYHAALRVERRSEAERRDGHVPPAVLETDGASEREVVERLAPIADSNVAVATALARWYAERRGGEPMELM